MAAATTPKSTPATSAVFTHLFQSHTALTKQEVARALDLSLPTVYQAFTNLESENLLTTSAMRESTGGRRATTYEINAEAAGAIGIYLTGSHLSYVTCDLYGNRFSDLSARIALPEPSTAAHLAQAIDEVVRELAASFRARDMKLAGVGIAVPSPIEPETGKLLNTAIVRISDPVVYARDLIGTPPQPTVVFNDAECGAFAQVFPQHSDKSLVYFTLERGLGGAILLNGQLFAGTRGLSGEVGHICVEPHGRPCSCGKQGCLEAYCSAGALREETGVDLQTFFNQVDAGDQRARAILDEYLDHLARGIQTVHTILDVPVALGGILSTHLLPHMDELNARVRALDPFIDDNVVLFAKHPFNGVALGAAQRMIERYVTSR